MHCFSSEARGEDGGDECGAGATEHSVKCSPGSLTLACVQAWHGLYHQCKLRQLPEPPCASDSS